MIPKINTDLERIGDFAENIARFIIRQDGEPIDKALIEQLRLKEMSEGVLDMLKTSKESLEKRDLAMANSLFEKDNTLDEINANVNNVLTTYMKDHPDKTTMCLDLKGVFLRLERTGDHITNLAEEIVFYIDAVVLKHSSDKSNKEKALINKMKEYNN